MGTFSRSRSGFSRRHERRCPKIQGARRLIDRAILMTAHAAPRPCAQVVCTNDLFFVLEPSTSTDRSTVGAFTHVSVIHSKSGTVSTPDITNSILGMVSLGTLDWYERWLYDYYNEIAAPGSTMYRSKAIQRMLIVHFLPPEV